MKLIIYSFHAQSLDNYKGPSDCLNVRTDKTARAKHQQYKSSYANLPTNATT